MIRVLTILLGGTQLTQALDAPDGHLAFATVIAGPNGAVPTLNDAAVNDDTTSVVAIVYRPSPSVIQGDIVLLNAAGQQIALFSTGFYMPSHVTFGPGNTIWTRGWERDTGDSRREDKQDYGIVRRFNLKGQETGAFVKRSGFPAGLSPGGTWGGRWGIRNAGERLVWLELDSSGAELGRWRLPSGHNEGYAFTSHGLYAVNRSWIDDQNHGTWELAILDKPSSTWKPLSTVAYTRDAPCDCGSLMDADGEQLVFAKQHGSTLKWVKP